MALGIFKKCPYICSNWEYCRATAIAGAYWDIWYTHVLRCRIFGCMNLMDEGQIILFQVKSDLVRIAEARK
jgi:hypothetical protein